VLGFGVSGRGLGGGGRQGGIGRTRLPISACLGLLRGVLRPRRPRLPSHLLWVWEAVLLDVSIVRIRWVLCLKNDCLQTWT
jgi:hypothetical protein